MTKSLHLVFGGPTAPEHEAVVQEWYREHLSHMCSLPGVIGAHLFRPNGTQFPRTTTKVPETLGVFEIDTDDVADAVQAIEKAHREGREGGVFKPGVAVPGPPPGTFALDSRYQPAFYDQVRQYPEEPSWRLTANKVFTVFGAPTSPDVADEVFEWYDPHLEHICSLLGVTAGQRYQRSPAQFEDLSVSLPEVFAFYEMDTDDLDAAVAAMWSAHIEGMKTGVYRPGLSIPGPRDGVWDIDPYYQSAFYDLVARETVD